jgi:nicotinamide-nucleotide amidase
MFMKTVLPLLRDRAGEGTTVSREVLVAGLGESHTHEKISDLVDAQSNPTIAYLAGFGLVRVRLTAKAGSENEAFTLIAPVEAEIRKRLGDHAVDGEGRSMAQVVGRMLMERSENVAVAESLTGGLMGAALTETEGASDFFLGGVVSYSTEAKEDVLGVDGDLLAGDGPVSEAAAGQMAEGAARLFRAELGLSTTGVAGPASHDGHPPGTVYVGATYKGRTEVRRVRGYGDRASVRGIAVTSALDLGRRIMLGR